MALLSKRAPMFQTLHDRMVRTRAHELLSQGYSVAADIPGFQQPPEIGGHIPDIFAVKGLSKIIVEAETCDTACSDHTRQQWTVFSNVPGTEFHVIVPESCISKAQHCATIWGVRVDQWWFEKGC